MRTASRSDTYSSNGTNPPEAAPVVAPVIVVPGGRAGIDPSSRLQETERDEPHDEEYEIKWEANEKNVERCAEEEGKDDGYAGGDHGVDDATINRDISQANKITKATQQSQNNDGTCGLGEA